MAPRTTLIRRLLFQLWLADGRRKLRHLAPHLGSAQRVLDIGCGVGSVTSLLRGYGHQVSALDIANQSLTDSVVPQLFDGKSIPFDDRSFDVALLLTVLHHCHDPDRLLGEASRVARQVFVIEDVYRGRLQKALTLAADSVLNVEFRGHPHNNRSVDQWLATFERLALSGTQVASWPVAGIFRQSLFRVARS